MKHDHARPGQPASQALRPSSTRSGSTIGVRVWMRRRRRCGTVRSASVSCVSRASLSDSGSPPERMISSIDESPRWPRARSASAGLPRRGLVGKFATEAVAAMHRAGAGADQQRPAVIFVQQARRAHGGVRRADRRRIRVVDQLARARQHLQQQRGSFGSPRRMRARSRAARAAERRGARRGGACAGSASCGSRSSSGSSSSGSVMACASSRCQAARVRAEPSGWRVKVDAVIIRALFDGRHCAAAYRAEKKWPATRPMNSNRVCAS
jgi:hypothetical protein